jgi:two-component system response regulator NreC
MVVDTFELISIGLSHIVESNGAFSVVARARTMDDAVRYALGHKPDLAILGPNLIQEWISESQPEIVAAIRKASPDTRVVVLTRGGELPNIPEGFEAGADGAVLASANQGELLEALHRVFEGEGYVTPRLAREIFRKQREETENLLSPREMEVLEGVAFGYTNNEISNHLHLSVRTVEAHRASIADKLGLKSRADLVHHAIGLGMMKDGDIHWVGDET